ncbi:MAG: hypothetical protein RBU45_12675 [Myxococcota bacterium]|jgi:hypothetical protein|nr:hypothetical protein [Myxococcota bacterium]
MPGPTCEVCGSYLEENYNETGLIGRYGRVAELCTLHHPAAAEMLRRHGGVNWRAMNRATSLMNQERPNAIREPERWADFLPYERLLELYEEEIARDPSDWPPFEPFAAELDPPKEDESADTYLYR